MNLRFSRNPFPRAGRSVALALIMTATVDAEEREDPSAVAFLLVGIRSYGSTFAWDLAVLAGPKLDFGGSSKKVLTLFPVPHCSLIWFL